MLIINSVAGFRYFFNFDVPFIDMRYTLCSLFLSTVVLVACHNDKGTDADLTKSLNANVVHKDTVMTMKKSDMVIDSIPFPTNILDTLHYIHANYQGGLTNSVDNVSLYSQSNEEAINLGIYGTDLAYVISFEQFQQVGSFMRATKTMADKSSVPMVFTQNVMERCQKNSRNRDSLAQIVYQSYNLINSTLKNDKRTTMQILVLAGGWVEGAYLTTQSLQILTSPTDKQGGFNVLMDQKQYLDRLLNQLDLIADVPYCTDLSTALHEIRGIFSNVSTKSGIDETALKNLTDKLSSLRARLVKGGNV